MVFAKVSRVSQGSRLMNIWYNRSLSHFESHSRFQKFEQVLFIL